MISRKRISMLGVGLVFASVAIAAPAMADNSGTLPSGCSISPTTPSLDSAKRIYFGGYAHCGAAPSADFRLVHNYDNVPDYRVKNANVGNSGTGNFQYFTLTCDSGGAKQYYSEIKLYVSGSPQRVSKTVTLSPC